MRRLTVICSFALIAAVSGCIQPSPIGVAPNPCHDFVEEVDWVSDLRKVGVSNALNNYRAHSSNDGTCGGPFFAELTIVTAANRDVAIQMCEDVYGDSDDMLAISLSPLEFVHFYVDIFGQRRFHLDAFTPGYPSLGPGQWECVLTTGMIWTAGGDVYPNQNFSHNPPT